jgi:hypothetical protein
VSSEPHERAERGGSAQGLGIVLSVGDEHRGRCALLAIAELTAEELHAALDEEQGGGVRPLAVGTSGKPAGDL